MTASEKKITPAMRQYYDIKKDHAHSILFFRMGDFYEMFDDDARIVSKELGLTLTTRNKNSENPIPLAGIPFHAADKYIAELTRKGYTISIAEQTSDPSLPGIVQREVAQIITPGTTIQTEALNDKEYNYLVSLTGSFPTCGVSLLDVSTGKWTIMECRSYEEALEEILTHVPREVLIDSSFFSLENSTHTLENAGIIVTTYDIPTDEDILLRHFQVPHVGILGLTETPNAAKAATLALSYVYSTQKHKPSHIQHPTIQTKQGTMILDRNTIRNLELFSTMRDHQVEGSLLYLLDQTMTGPGGRMLRTWMLSPLLNQSILTERLDAVEYLYTHSHLRKHIRALLNKTYDIERISARLAMGRGNARDLLSIGQTLESLQELTSALQIDGSTPKLLESIYDTLSKGTASELARLIEQAISPEAGVSITEGGIIKDGYDSEVDELRHIKRKAKEWMMEYQQKEQESSGISQIKVKYTSVFGYFLEIPKSQVAKVPLHYVRKQTLVSAERYITEELKVFEEKVLTSEEQISTKEYELFQILLEQVLNHMPYIQEVTHAIATLDTLSSFAEISHREEFVRPTFSQDISSHIVEGKHPVVSHSIRSQGQIFVPNTSTFIKDREELLLITGPNMAGKSTYLRQVALISYMAQIGCFIPATSAQLPLYDRIFTRVGASDNMSQGESTFMVEMQEASYILHNATPHSLIILDEIGRGTSTYDGMSIAWAIMSHIHDTIRAHTLFATHYHELIDIAEQLPKAKNYSVAIAENESGVIFLHHIIEGGASKSYGIEVAKLAGLPQTVVANAKKHLHTLESETTKQTATPTQDSLFTLVEEKTNPIAEKIWKDLQQMDVHHMTPIQTMERLSQLIALAKDSSRE